LSHITTDHSDYLEEWQVTFVKKNIVCFLCLWSQ
jgi:hypothetical protein